MAAIEPPDDKPSLSPHAGGSPERHRRAMIGSRERIAVVLGDFVKLLG